VYDCETYPNVFTISFEHVNAPIRLCFEISNYRDDTQALFEFLGFLRESFARLIGFNNVGFDYPVLHQLMKMGRCDAPTLYAKAKAVIGSQDKQERWSHLVKPTDRYIPQIDLMLIHHFDNGARMTSLKALEFNMRSLTIEDLPFPVGTVLDQQQIAVLKQYNAHDVAMTKKFYHHSKHMIAFRDELSEKYMRDFTNHNDTKIGKDYFVMQLTAAGVECYDYGRDGRKPKQTPRTSIRLADAILPWIQFEHPEFARVLAWLREQTIYGTKDTLKIREVTTNKKGEEKVKMLPVTATIDGLVYVFGTGGIHASRSAEIVEADDENMILDLDVTSFYPNLAIKNGFYPEHLGAQFVTIYETLFKQRGTYPKKSSESQMLKLALNGVYGDSGNPFSVFYDPLFTMKITMNGQLLLCLLTENLMKVPGLRVLQCNTDGVTVKLPRQHEPLLRQVCEWWQGVTKLTLEDVEYSRVNIRDVNNFVMVTTKGTTKRKGAYEWQAGSLYDSGYDGWNQDASFLVVPKVAEQVLVNGSPIRETVTNWPDVMDFMIRIKVPKSGYLMWGDERVQNTSRYIVTTDGKPLVKWLEPNANKDPEKWRSFNQEGGRKVTVCNRLTGAEKFNIDYDYYIEEVEKLVMVLK
jgi:hypothetical protein